MVWTGQLTAGPTASWNTLHLQMCWFLDVKPIAVAMPSQSHNLQSDGKSEFPIEVSGQLC